LDKVEQEIQKSVTVLLQEHHSIARHLPFLRNFISGEFGRVVKGLVNQEQKTLAIIVENEGVQPLPPRDQVPHAVSPDILAVILRLSNEDQCSICKEQMSPLDRPVDLLQCCGKHFHRHCLEGLIYPKCPLCRKDFEKRWASSDASRIDARQHLMPVKRMLLEQTGKAVAKIVHRLSALGLGKALEEAALDATAPKNLLDEDPQVQEKRNKLRYQLSVLEKVEQDVNGWDDEL
jgi:hypothetical protein